MIAIFIALGFGAYLGYSHDSFLTVLAVAFVSAAIFLWENRDLLKRSREDAWGPGSRPTLASRLTAVWIYGTLVLVALALEGGAYWGVRALHPISN